MTTSDPACPAFEVHGPAADLSHFDAPILLSLVATEEEFDWRGGFSREKTSTRAIDELHRVHDVLREYGVVPTYALDHPVASQRGADFRPWLDEGSAEIGAHLHPWVNPPHDERVGDLNSFPGNLDPDLEFAKLEQLVEAIEEGTGRRPLVYQAGRFGVARHTLAHLERLGFRIDASAAPPFDYRDEGGPDFSGIGTQPFWIDGTGALLEVPVTGAYIGRLRRSGARLYPIVRRRAFESLRMGGVLSRTGLLERSRLSPEGHTFEDMVRLTRHLARRGGRVFTFYFHSPTISPGCTEYVRDEPGRVAFLDRCRRYLDFFMGELGGRPMAHSALYDAVASRRR